METSALFTFPPDEDDEKNVYATRPPLLPAAVRSVAVAQMTFNRVCSIPSFPPSPSLVWPFDREESISQERHVSKVRERATPLPLLSPERCESPQDGEHRAREGGRQ